MKLSHLYADLGTQFSHQSLPDQPKKPQLLLWNNNLANELGLRFDEIQIAEYFSGQHLLPGSKPIAMAYSGHQFGHFNPQLGDGRAHLLGEVVNKHNQIQEIQLKGSGQTPYSRNGDGKCGIKPAVREYLMSEAIHAMGVPTTRSLAVVTTGEPVYRQVSTPGAVVTRVASSHLRVGTFEYFAARQMHAEIKKLADLTIIRHYPEIDQSDDSKYLKLLVYIIDNQITLITEWMRIGFIHGVMNTDNTLLSGETIDYGPCAMMGIYDPATVFSSIDHNGRYAYGNQANIAQWNMARLAECFLPLIATDEQQAIDLVMPLLEAFSDKYKQSFNLMMAKKLGIDQPTGEVIGLTQALLELLYKFQLDYTQTFVQLQNTLSSMDDQGLDVDRNLLNSNLIDWHQSWLYQLQQFQKKPAEAKQLMEQQNPLVIPRNHHVEHVLDQVETNLNTGAVQTFLSVIQSPYSMTENTRLYQDADNDLNYQTYCGT